VSVRLHFVVQTESFRNKADPEAAHVTPPQRPHPPRPITARRYSFPSFSFLFKYTSTQAQLFWPRSSNPLLSPGSVGFFYFRGSPVCFTWGPTSCRLRPVPLARNLCPRITTDFFVFPSFSFCSKTNQSVSPVLRGKKGPHQDAVCIEEDREATRPKRFSYGVEYSESVIWIFRPAGGHVHRASLYGPPSAKTSAPGAPFNVGLEIRREV